MKSLFTKLRGGAQSPLTQQQRPSSSSSTSTKDKENIASGSTSTRPAPQKRTSVFKGRSSSRANSPVVLRSSTPLTQSQPSLSPALASESTSTSSDSTRPHSLAVTGTEQDNENVEINPAAIAGLWPEERSRTVSAPNGEHEPVGLSTGVVGAGAGKKVTFRSPVPTPTTSVVLDEAVNLNLEAQSATTEKNEDLRGRASSRASSKRAVSTSPNKRHTPSAQSKTRPQVITRQSSPFLPSVTPRPPALRKASMPPLSNPSSLASPTLPYHRNISPSKGSILSPTPSEASFGAASTRSYLPPPNSWSEMAEDDLIANLSPRERTRQEVLWEIVSSEERYVQELIKLNETFCRNLLPPSAQSPHIDFFDYTATLSRTFSPTLSASPALSSDSISVANLPIAARYATPGRFNNVEGRIPSDSSTSTAGPVTPSEEMVARGMSSNLSVPPPSAAARMNAYNILTNGRPSEPIRKSSFSSLVHGRSHHSMPPVPRRANSSAQETHPTMSSLHARLSYQPGMQTNKLQKPHDRVTSGSSITPTNRDVHLPTELERLLTVLSGGILEGHIKLAAALKRRYENQYPLVRTLADVFTSHSYVLREYNSYVLNLEQALEQVDEALGLFSETHPHSNHGIKQSKRNSRRLEDTDQGKLGRLLLSLEELAAERGESGLVISLSKPFQRLLKYPLLFQNLLFNTDPSLREYEATLAMVDEVEVIVRQIEDEKSSSEEREKTRDIWARIDGLEKDKMLITPKPNRMLVSETQLPQSEGTDNKAKPKPKTGLDPATVKQKKSFKRLSDILKTGHMHENADVWVVRFSDVSLLCERTGVTHLPVSSLHKTKGEEGKPKFATTGKRGSSVRPRNMYKLVKVHEWHLRTQTGSTEGLLDMDDISRARSRQVSMEHPQPESPTRTQTQTPQAAPIRGTGMTKSTLASIPDMATPHVTPTKIPLKTGDGSPSPSKSIRSPARLARERDGDTDTIVSDRMSVMSFAFKGSDQMKPVSQTRTRPTPSNTGRATTGTGTGTVLKSPPRAGGLQRRQSGGYVAGSAADAKFANRLRTGISSQDDNGETIRAGVTSRSKARQSLPPAMINQRTNTNGHAGTGSMPPSVITARPAWNAGSRAGSSAGSVKASVTAGGARPRVLSNLGAKRVPSGSAPPTSTQAAASAGTTSLEGGKNVIPRSQTPSKDYEVGIKKSTEDLAGLWKEYGAFDGLAGNGTPVKGVKVGSGAGSVQGHGRTGSVGLSGRGRGRGTPFRPVAGGVGRGGTSISSRRTVGTRI